MGKRSGLRFATGLLNTSPGSPRVASAERSDFTPHVADCVWMSHPVRCWPSAPEPATVRPDGDPLSPTRAWGRPAAARSGASAWAPWDGDERLTFTHVSQLRRTAAVIR